MTGFTTSPAFRAAGFSAAAAWAAIFAGDGALASDDAVDFNRDIRPILSDRCFFCHGPDEAERKADLRLDTREGATADRDGVRAIDLENPELSELLFRIRTDDESELMPPPDSGKSLSEEEMAVLERWVAAGAPWEEHWAFTPPEKSAPAPSTAAHWIRGPIDSFVAERLAEEGIAPNPEADRETLIRRVTFDLTGLPPTIPQIDAFLADEQGGAYERVIDRLLDSPAFGERMALAWMDAARYGDSSVMHADGPRDMWPWRDWVIRAYNANMAFDRFTVEQLAGDLLPDATVDQKIASGFNRNHATSDEGGAIPEELRVTYVVDRVRTTANTWMALTMECVQCHDHKYDPISQREYYQFFAYFNQTKDGGMQTRNGNADPVVRFFADPADEARRNELADELAGVESALESRRGEAAEAFAAWDAVMRTQGESALPEPDGLLHRFEIDASAAAVTETASGISAALAGGAESCERDGSPALRLSGREAAADFPDAGKTIERGEPFTFSAWVRPEPGGANGAIFARMDVSGSYRGFDLWTQDGEVGVHLIHSWPDNAVKTVSQEKLKDEHWQHVAVIFDGSDKAAGVSVFIDGKRVGTKVEQDSLSGSIVADTPLRIGARSSGGGFRGEVSDIRIYERALDEAERERIAGNPVGALLAIAPAERSDAQREELLGYFLRTEDSAWQKLTADRERLSAEVKALDERRISSMIMEEMEAPRPTYILDRGAYDAPKKDEVITPGTPAVLPALGEEAPPNRLGLAHWLVRPDHPLTARVAVNRYWAMLFGEGLVRTVSDFGAQGEMPSHPKLLDWLAVDFVESGWDIKRMLRQIVTSSTYRQSSRVTKEKFAADPENRLLARGPRFRLPGEFIRDQALAVSGLLVDKVGGPGVKPYQPPGLWNEVSLDGNLRFQQDSGEALYRRSMYIYWKRSAPHPAMTAFDAPTREVCVVQRARTNTPLQALVTLNDTQFVEAARFFAERLLREGDSSLGNRDRLTRGFRAMTGRAPDSRESGALLEALQTQLEIYRGDPEAAEALLSTGEASRDESLDPALHAAWTNVAAILLNLDETLTRG